MTTVTRKQFATQVKRQHIDLSKVSGEQEGRLEKAGMSKEQLAKADLDNNGRISGSKESDALFKQIDNFDVNGNRESIQTRKPGVQRSTAAGKAYNEVSLLMSEHTQQTQFASGAEQSPRSWDDVARGNKIMGEGHRGWPVKKMQQKLTRAGFGVQDTGVFGPTTQKTVEAFQRKHGLPDHGKVDANTAAELEWQGVKGGHSLIKPGDSGEAVRRMQEKLTKAGFGVQQTGIFGPTTTDTLKKFQESKGIQQTGVLGPQTLAALEQGGKVNAAQSTSGMSESQKFDHYKAIIEQNGGQFKPGPNQRNLLSLRTPTNTNTNGGRGAYDDQTVMLWQDANGRKHVRSYRSNTEPTAQYRGSMGVDANGDGRLDQGRLPAGHYEYVKSYDGKFGNILYPVKAAMADRDTNQDGWFNDGAQASAGNTMLFHSGSYNDTDSAGCQTFRPDDFDRFWRDLNSSGNPGRIGYTLVNL